MGPSTRGPKTSTISASPGEPAATASRARTSESTSTAPSSTSRRATVDLPDPMPPVRPTRSTPGEVGGSAVPGRSRLRLPRTPWPAPGQGRARAAELGGGVTAASVRSARSTSVSAGARPLGCGTRDGSTRVTVPGPLTVVSSASPDRSTSTAGAVPSCRSRRASPLSALTLIRQCSAAAAPSMYSPALRFEQRGPAQAGRGCRADVLAGEPLRAADGRRRRADDRADGDGVERQAEQGAQVRYREQTLTVVGQPRILPCRRVVGPLRRSREGRHGELCLTGARGTRRERPDEHKGHHGRHEHEQKRATNVPPAHALNGRAISASTGLTTRDRDLY